jgi:hypothetical protein
MENFIVFFCNPEIRLVDNGGRAVDESFGQVKGDEDATEDTVDDVAIEAMDLRGVGETLGASLCLLLPLAFVTEEAVLAYTDTAGVAVLVLAVTGTVPAADWSLL